MTFSNPHSLPTARGKVILLGEHAVVYGHPALAGSIDRGVSVSEATIEKTTQGRSRLCIPAWNLDVDSTSEHPVSLAFSAMLHAAAVGSAELHLQANLPCAAGLGSSAAMCVAIARCLAQESQVKHIANVGEACFHEKPSGIDVALSIGGGIATYHKDTGLAPLSCPVVTVVVALSKHPRSTAKMVGLVRERVSQDPKLGSVLASIGSLALEGASALQKHELGHLGDAMNRCHNYLVQLGVSIPILDSMVNTAREAGALGAKLTGAGGGGAILALTPKSAEQEVCSALESAGFESFIAQVGNAPCQKLL